MAERGELCGGRAGRGGGLEGGRGPAEAGLPSPHPHSLPLTPTCTLSLLSTRPRLQPQYITLKTTHQAISPLLAIPSFPQPPCPVATKPCVAVVFFPSLICSFDGGLFLIVWVEVTEPQQRRPCPAPPRPAPPRPTNFPSSPSNLYFFAPVIATIHPSIHLF